MTQRLVILPQSFSISLSSNTKGLFNSTFVMLQMAFFSVRLKKWFASSTVSWICFLCFDNCSEKQNSNNNTMILHTLPLLSNLIIYIIYTRMISVKQHMIKQAKIDQPLLLRTILYKLFSIIQMINYSNSLKPRPKNNAELSAPYFHTFQPEIVRKTAPNNPPTLKPQPVTNLARKEKLTYRRFHTETNDPDPTLLTDKYITRPPKIPSKTDSPPTKDTIVTDPSPSKLYFHTTAGKIKRVIKIPPSNQRLTTEPSPIPQRTVNSDHPQFPVEKQKQKFSVVIPEKKYLDHKKSEMLTKRIMENSSNPKLFVKPRLNTEGTKDSAPSLLSAHDIELLEIIGQGTFGKVYKGVIKRTGQIIAVKKVFQDPKYKNREVQIVNMLRGDFVMRVLGCYNTYEEQSQYLNIAMTYYDGDLFNYIKQHSRKGLSTMDIKLFSYQIFRGMLHIHQLKIAHRDMKPHNVLYKDKKAVICDFGSAKVLTKQPNLPYICSRCYRAPELIFGATHYNTMIDIWSVGCIMLEMIQGTPLFMGETSIDHLIEIIKVLGTPTKSQVVDMNPSYDLNEYKFPKVKKRQWSKIFPKSDPLLLDLINQIMVFSPLQRLNAAQALAHEFFDQLREEPVSRMLQKQCDLRLFQFSNEQLKGHEHLMPKLLPEWCRITKRYAPYP